MYIETQRLILKEYRKEDTAEYFNLTSCKQVWQYSTFTPLSDIAKSEQQLTEIIQNYSITGCGFMALREKASNRYIGEAGIIHYNENTNRCEIGYNLLPQFWKKGFATEITLSLVKYAFETMLAERIEALVIQDNIGSCRVLEKAGFRLEGVLRNFNKHGGLYRNVCYYGIISEDYSLI